MTFIKVQDTENDLTRNIMRNEVEKIMVDPVQNLPGTITSANIPSRSDNAPTNVSHSTVDNSSSPSGTSAPAPAVPASSESGLQLSDAAKRVVDSMADAPPPVDVVAVQQIKEAIRNNEYPMDYDKVAEKLMENLQQLSD